MKAVKLIRINDFDREAASRQLLSMGFFLSLSRCKIRSFFQ
jgi:hypothetical protein